MSGIIRPVFSGIQIMAALLISALSLTAADNNLMVVHRQAPGSWTLEWRGKVYRCAVGRNGIAQAGDKREGDGKTPSGTYALRRLYFRPDKVDQDRLPASLRPLALTPSDGWCDQPDSPDYNRFVLLPFAASHEELWRGKDDLYDLIVPLGYNDDPVVPGLGSAIFLHVASARYGPTAGCVALSKQDLLEVLQTVATGCRMRIDPERP
jgi:L,D-peptidoglycan transpeptidase YkuD (ErfK/YbiS/YcfS/YnhG family)